MATAQAIGDGRKTVATAGTAEKLAASTMATYVCIVAETDNTGTICVGSSTVVAAQSTRRGVPLLAGASVSLKSVNLAEIWLDTTVNGDGVTFMYIN